MERNLVILYGSQTGTAEDVAKRIRKQARMRRFNTTLKALNDFSVDELINTPLIVFVCSTTGQGDPPTNMEKFWRLMLRRRLPNNALAHLDFAVLGLGDSSYMEFNFAGKRLHRRLLKLGATPFHELGLADDQHELGVDGVAEPWIAALMEKLMAKFPLLDGEDVIGDEGLPVPSFLVQFLSDDSEITSNSKDVASVKSSIDPPLFGMVLLPLSIHWLIDCPVGRSTHQMVESSLDWLIDLITCISLGWIQRMRCSFFSQTDIEWAGNSQGAFSRRPFHEIRHGRLQT